MAKYLINSDFKVRMKGAYVKTMDPGDFVYDTEEGNLTTAQMKEIAAANGFKLKGKKAAEMKESLDSQLETIKVPKRDKMTDTEKYKSIVKEMHEEGSSDEEILIALVKEGVKFTKAVSMLRRLMIELGLDIKPKERKEKAKEILEELEFEPESYSEVEEAANELAEKIPNTSVSTALSLIRQYAKENDIELPAKPKVIAIPFTSKAIAWIHQNPDAENDDFEEWMEEQNRSENTIKLWLKNFEGFKRALAQS